jgi:ankyrin repeat protein
MFFGLFGGEKKRVAEMIAAARSGDTEKIKQLLSKGADINAPEPESGDTPLLAAIDKRQWAAAEHLLKQGPDLSLVDKNGNSPLYLAVSRGDSALAMVNLLLEAGAPVDLGLTHGDNAGATPLHIACATGANKCLESLLRHGASATKQIPSGATPLHTAAIGGDQRTIELLCKAGGSVTALTEDKRAPLHNCGITGNAKVAAALIQQGAPADEVDAEGCTPLMHAVTKHHTEVAKVLLDHGANPDVVVRTGETPLYPLFVAVMNGYDDLVRILLDKGANAAAKVEGAPSLVTVAKQKGYESVSKLLAGALKRHKTADKANKAVDTIWVDLVAALNGANAQQLLKLAAKPAFAKLTPNQQLIVQSVLGAAEKVQALLSSGASPNISFDDVLFGAPVLYVSAGREGSTDVVALLLAAGADPHLTQKDGSNAFHLAAKRGNVGTAKLLMDRGVNPNVAYQGSVPPLIDACITGNKRMVDALIDGGADVNAVLEMGFCAFVAALDNKRMKLAEHLLERGAIPSFGEVDTLPLAVAEHGSISLIKAIELRGGSIVRPDMLSRVAFVAARNKDGEVLDYVLSHGADLSQDNDLNYTSLILASLANRPMLVERYLARGDDAGLQDADGETALSLAIENEHGEVVDILRRHSAQVVDYPGLAKPEQMFSAAAAGALGTILNLHDAGISINIDDAAGNSPLLLAAQAGHVGVVRSLYHLGADINHRNIAGKSPSNLAKEANQQQVLKTLMEFGAEDAAHHVYGFIQSEGGDGHRRTIDMGDAMLGRYSHPFKHRLPYGDEPEEMDTESDEDLESDDAVEIQAEGSGPVVSEEVAEMLGQLENLLAQEHIIERMSPQNHEVITARIKLVWANGEGAIPRAQLDELTEVCEILANQPVAEVAPPPLFEAASAGNLQAFRKLIKGGAKVEETMPDGTTLLMTASQNGHDGIVKELIAAGVDVNLRQSESFTALIFATFLEHESIVKLLVASGADVNTGHSMPSSQGTSGGQTALSVASQRKNLSMCKLLVKLGGDVNVITEAGYTPLMWSLVNAEDGNCAKFLLQSGANPDPDAVPSVSFSTLTSPLILAATNGTTEIVKELIRQQVRLDKPDGDGWTAIKRAANARHTDVVALLLKAGAAPDVRDDEGWTALINAAGRGEIAICRALLKAGADANAKANAGKTPLLQAIGARSDNKALDAIDDLRRMFGEEEEGAENQELDSEKEHSLDLIKLLLKAGASPNVQNDGVSLLAEAKSNDDQELAKLLLKHGALETFADEEVGHGDVPESEEGQALVAAAIQADPKALRELVQAGVDVNYKSFSGQTALGLLLAGLRDDSSSRAYRRSAEQCLDYLLTHGANPDVADPSPLVLVAMDHRLHLVQSMLLAGADVNRKMSEGQTALFMSLLAPDAGKQVDDRCTIALLKAGADPALRHESGAMPIHLAAGSNYLLALKELLDRRPQDVDAKTNIGITPLMMAATEGHAAAVSLLLSFGADLALKNDGGLTAKDVAIKNGNEDLAPLLS